MTLIDKIKDWKNRRSEEMVQNEIDDNAPPRQIRDRYLESLERERQFQMNQDRKELLKLQIAQYKKKKMAEQLYGIKTKREKTKSYLNTDLKRKVDIMNGRNNMLKQKSILSQKSLLNNRTDEFRKRKRGF
jgi:hypothetical protein